jgi:hypothetical protein
MTLENRKQLFLEALYITLVNPNPEHYGNIAGD